MTSSFHDEKELYKMVTAFGTYPDTMDRDSIFNDLINQYGEVLSERCILCNHPTTEVGITLEHQEEEDRILGSYEKGTIRAVIYPMCGEHVYSTKFSHDFDTKVRPKLLQERN